MVFAGLADARNEDVRASHNKFLEQWFNIHGEEFLVVLTDTFGTVFFFGGFTPEQAEKWCGLRQDSGVTFNFGEKAINFNRGLGIDPASKTIVFSDGLDINQILAIQKAFEGNRNTVFGWGTSLTNDLGPEVLNIVMKATHFKDMDTLQEAETVKLSDDIGKCLGPSWLVKLYRNNFFKVKG